MRSSIVVLDDFYSDPFAIRAYALRQPYYTPYESDEAVASGVAAPTWWASRYRRADECPFKSAPTLRQALEAAVGETIDLAHWRNPYPLDDQDRPLSSPSARDRACLWNCSFHVKPANHQKLGEGVHNHVTDRWNSVGCDGWAGVVYLSPDAPLEGGLHLWRHRDPRRRYDWMTSAENWELVDRFGNIFNRLVLVRGDKPHSGAGGWGSRINEGRLYQTFFFRTVTAATRPVAFVGEDLGT